MKLRVIVASLSLLSATPAVSEAQAAAGPPMPDLSAMMFFVGSWTCNIVKSPSPKRIGNLSKVTVAPEPGGYWLTQTTEHGTSFITWDAKTKVWAFIGLGAGGYGIGTSPGWSGDTLVVADRFNSGNDALGTTTFKRAGDTYFDVTYTVPGPVAMTETQTCTKPAS
jgi:hypothetical protein